MRLLLDTHTLVWWDDDRLPRRVTAAIQAADTVFVSAVTAWEIAIKSALGKLAARGTVAEVVRLEHPGRPQGLVELLACHELAAERSLVDPPVVNE